MKEIIGLATIEEVKAITSTVEGDRNIVAPVHCSWCTNCSGIVGD